MKFNTICTMGISGILYWSGCYWSKHPTWICGGWDLTVKDASKSAGGTWRIWFDRL